MEDIAAQHLDRMIFVTPDDGEERIEISYCPLYYCASVKANGNGIYTEILQNVVTALYLYNQETIAYFYPEER